jgi:hypothetical protein
MSRRRKALGLFLALASTTAVLASQPATAAVGIVPLRPISPGRPAAVPATHRPPALGQHITGHPNVLTAVNTARAKRGWPPVKAGSNTAAEACALNSTRCNGVQWGGCSLTPLAGNQYTATIGTAESNGPRGCVEAISYSSFT